jgi:signal transduction histidine kinase
MTRIKTAKQLTFTYFSVVAFAITVFHFSMLESMIESIESIYAESRMLKDRNTAIEKLQGTELTYLSVPPFSEVYVGKASLPAGIVLNTDMKDDKPYELDESSDTRLEIFSMRSQVILNGKPQELYLLHYDEIYETSEEQMFKTQSTQLFLSILLLVVSLWVVMRIAGRLTQPLALLSNSLSKRNASDLSPIALPDGAVTFEVHQLVERLNAYQDQINTMIERERAFNRHASHELRTPLMVMKGVATLLGKSDSKEFLERQRQRINTACNEMEDYITTLLSLTRAEDLSSIAYRLVLNKELEEIRDEHLMNKSVVVKLVHTGQIMTKLPIPTFHILVGNLLKNAMACTESGHVIIEVSDHSLAIIDTGCGLQGKPSGESYGLGLMIVRDICTKYHCDFRLADNNEVGCTATVTFPQPD